MSKLVAYFSIKNKFLLFIILISIINLIFYFKTLNNSWASDDYSIIFGTKLYNLINQQNFFLFINLDIRFQPTYWFIAQFIPSNYKIWHFFVILIYIFTSIIFYYVAKILTKDKNVSLVASTLFTLNYSISAKSLMWACFYGHIFNTFLGLIASLLFYKFCTIKKKISYLYLILFIFFSLVNFGITEGGIIYLFLNLFIIFHSLKENFVHKILKSLINFTPLLFYFILSFHFSGSSIKTLKERANVETQNYYKNILSQAGDLYYYRSTYSPRNTKGYSLRILDNFLNSINLGSLEKSLAYYDDDKKIKQFIKKNHIILISSLVFIVIVLGLNISHLLKKNKKLKSYVNYIIFYISILLIYSLLFHRKDINLLLSIASSLILAKLIIDFKRIGKQIFTILTIILFVSPSLLYVSTGINFFGDFNAKDNLNNFNNLNSEKFNEENFYELNKKEIKFYYYYKNFDKEQNYLQKYKGQKYPNFIENFLK